MRRASIAVLLAAALLVWAPGALAKTHAVSSFGQVSGEIVVSWHGDPARGCAAAGVCDVSGSLVYRPDSVEVRGRLFDTGRFAPVEADLDSQGPSTVRVRRLTSSGGSALCVDTVDTSSFYLAPRRQGDSRYTFNGIPGGP